MSGPMCSAAAVGVEAQTSAASAAKRFVGLMTDPRDDGRLQASQLPHQTLVIEGGQVLEGAAAANEQDDVGPGRIRTIECSHKRQRSRLPPAHRRAKA